MPAAPLPPNETDRLRALRACGILDTPPDPRFESIVRLAAHLFSAPAALVSFIDENRQWFKASIGLDERTTPRELAFCAYTILRPAEVSVVEDATVDPRFADNPFVTGKPGIRFYAGAPILDSSGHALGSLCVIDYVSRPPPQAADLRALTDLAQGVSSALELHASLEAARQAALHDPLTGLANRVLLEQRLQEVLAVASDDSNCCSFAIFCLDLDRFKIVNDLLGHAGGDTLLRETARRLNKVVRASDMVARLGGDEFVVLAAVTIPAEAELLAARIIDALEAPFIIEGQSVPIRTSVGFVLCPADTTEVSTLLRRADAALYEAKRQGRGRGVRFNLVMEHALAERQALERDLRAALAKSAFRLYWQPIANARTGEILGYEALLRWNRDRYGPVSPSDFVPVAEACGLSGQLDEWVLRAACHEAANWSAPLRVAVNLSAARFQVGGLPELVATVLQETGLAPWRLELELTEGTLIKDHAAAIATLEDLRGLGVEVALDDFGIGYSSLGYLHTLPLGKVKLDRSFIQNLGASERAASVVRAALQLCHSLGMIVCAEGVETESQRAFLNTEGCDQIQGFLIGRPTSLPVFDGLPQMPS